jgi:ribonuclease HI
MSLPKVELWTDGACSGNGREHSSGGWASLLIFGRAADGPAAAAVTARLVSAVGALAEPGPVTVPVGPEHVVRALALWGGEKPSTNNRMEQMGLLRGLQALRRPTHVQVHIDSNYVMQAFTNRWLANWQRNGWKNSKKQPVPNRDLWEQLLEAVAPHRLEFIKVKGHAGVDLNECVDRLAVAACPR